MSKWTSEDHYVHPPDENPGHKRRLAMWREIEAEFGEPIRDVIIGLREVDGGNSWRTVAGCLDICRTTLLEWRKALDIGVDTSDKRYDPSSYPDGKPIQHLDHRAKKLGYEDAKDAVLDLRLEQGLTIKEAANVLDCHYNTITKHTPPSLRGEIYNHSDGWLEQRRAWAADMLERSRAANAHHPFRAANDAMFGEREKGASGGSPE